MSRISGDTGNSVRASARQPSGVDDPESPQAALRRLRLKGEAGEPYADVVRLGSDDLRTAVRGIDAERERLDQAFLGSERGLTALKAIGAALDDIGKLAGETARAGLGKSQRRTNQSKIDQRLAEIDAAITDDPETETLFAGDTTLTAGTQSLKVDRVSLGALGRLVSNGRALSLKDLASGEYLDTSERRASRAAAAKRSIDEAAETVRSLEERLTAFARDEVVPRIGDVATVMEGLLGSVGGGQLGSSDTALGVARDVRALLIESGTAAVIAGADGWDRERLLELLSP